MESFYYITEGISSILLSIFLIVLIVLFLYLLSMMRSAKKKAEVAIEKSMETAKETRIIAEKVGRTITDYILIKALNLITKRKGK